MTAALSGLGFDMVTGEANYLLMHCADSGLCEKLRRKGILIRDCSGYDGLGPGWYRAAIRTEEENDALLKALWEVL